MTPPTARQKQILDFMRKYHAENRFPASVREIMAATGISSPNGVSGHLKALKTKGLVTTATPRRARSWMVVDDPGDPFDKAVELLRMLVMDDWPSGPLTIRGKIEKFLREQGDDQKAQDVGSLLQGEKNLQRGIIPKNATDSPSTEKAS